MREMAEQNLNQSKAALEQFFHMSQTAADSVDHQARVMRKQSISLAEELLSNAFDFGHKLVRVREPHEFAELQNEFVNRQTQMLADQTKEFGQSIVRAADEMTKTANEQRANNWRRQSEAA